MLWPAPPAHHRRRQSIGWRPLFPAEWQCTGMNRLQRKQGGCLWTAAPAPQGLASLHQPGERKPAQTARKLEGITAASPRASARGSRGREARGQIHSWRAIPFPDFPPALAGGSPLGLVLYCAVLTPHSLWTRPNGKRVREPRQGLHGWGPRASARGNPVCEGGARNRASLRALHSPDFAPGLGRGLPFRAASCERYFPRIFSGIAQTRNAFVSGREGGARSDKRKHGSRFGAGYWLSFRW